MEQCNTTLCALEARWRITLSAVDDGLRAGRFFGALSEVYTYHSNQVRGDEGGGSGGMGVRSECGGLQEALEILVSERNEVRGDGALGDGREIERDRGAKGACRTFAVSHFYM